MSKITITPFTSMKDKRIIIGIDPGVTTGFAVWDKKHKGWIEISSLSIVEAMERIHGIADLARKVMEAAALPALAAVSKPNYSHIHIRFEDARKSYIPEKDRKAGREQGAGSVKRDSHIWEEFCQHYGISYEAMSPQACARVPGGVSLPAGKGRKISPGAPKGKDCTAESFSRVTGWKGKTNGHERDAAMWVWGY